MTYPQWWFTKGALDKVHYVGCLTPPKEVSRRPLRIHQLRKFTKVTGQSCKTCVLLYWPIFEVHRFSENRWINPVVPATARLHASLEYIDTHVSRYSRFARAYELDIASSQEIVILPTSKREIKLRLKSRWRTPPGPPAGFCSQALLRKKRNKALVGLAWEQSPARGAGGLVSKICMVKEKPLYCSIPVVSNTWRPEVK